MQTRIIGKDDIENLNYLAEEVLMQLRYEGYRYDDEGNDKFPYQEGNENSDTRLAIDWQIRCCYYLQIKLG